MTANTHTEGVVLEYLERHLAHRTVALGVILGVFNVHNMPTVATGRVYDE